MKQARMKYHCFWSVVLLVNLALLFAVGGEAKNVSLTIRGVTSIAQTDENFICATIDWWPEDKCDYGQCPWGKAGLNNLDLRNEILFKAVKAFGPLRVRIGGSLEDQILYNVGGAIDSCTKMTKDPKGMFGFSKGCLEMDRWDEINKFIKETGAVLTFGVNALFGRIRLQGSDRYVGDWNSQNTEDFMAYSVSKGYKIDSYEFGNELCGGGVSGRVDAKQYAKDMQVLKQLVLKLYQDPSNQPKVLGPAGFYDKEWFDEFLQASGPNVVDGLTHHIYNLGPGSDSGLIDRIQDPYYLDNIAETFKDVSTSANLFGPWAGAWVGEAGGAYNSGGKEVSHTFANGFWYLDQLGMTSTFNHKVYCRQALIGGNYALLNSTHFVPNPDYYGALLWHRLMGTKVLSTSHDGNPYLRAYTHCSRTNPGVAILLINMAKSTTYNVSLVNDLNLYPWPGEVKTQFQGSQQREEYHLTPQGGDILTDVVLLNGKQLKLGENFEIPDMPPKLVDASSPLLVRPQSFLFVTVRDLHAPACA